MSETPHKPDFLEAAKHQFAQISAEFEKAVETLKDAERRKQLTSSYLDLLQKGLSRAQDTVARYQEKVAPQPTAAAPDDGSASDASSAAGPMTATPDSERETPPS
jgi:hypothetical protein